MLSPVHYYINVSDVQGHATAGVAGEVTNGGVTAATAIVGVRPLAKRGPETGGGPEARLTPAGAPTQGRGRGAGQGSIDNKSSHYLEKI